MTSVTQTQNRRGIGTLIDDTGGFADEGMHLKLDADVVLALYRILRLTARFRLFQSTESKR